MGEMAGMFMWDDRDLETSMGEEYQQDMLANQGLRDGLLSSGIWVTKDGAEIRISDMSTSHIKNCIKMFERCGEDDDYLTLMEAELKTRGENNGK